MNSKDGYSRNKGHAENINYGFTTIQGRVHINKGANTHEPRRRWALGGPANVAIRFNSIDNPGEVRY